MVGNLRRDKTPPVSRMSYPISSFEGIDAYKPENQLPLKIGSYGYNIQFKGGNLQGTIGVGNPTYVVGETTRTLPTLNFHGDRLKRMHHYRCVKNGVQKDLLIGFSKEGHFYTTRLNNQEEFFLLNGIEAEEGSDAEFVNYYMNGKDTLLIFYSGGIASYDGETLTLKGSSPCLKSTALIYDRVFGIDGNDKLYFSAPLNPTDFSVEGGGGSLSFMDEGGRLLKIMVLGSELYVFREYAIYRLSVLGAPKDYVLQKVLSTDSIIVPGSISDVGGSLYLCVGTKLYVFNGYTLREIQKGLTALIESTAYSASTFFDNYYYLSCLLKTEGEIIGDELDLPIKCNNGIILINVITGSVGIMRGADVVSFVPVLTDAVKEIFVVYANSRSHRAGKITYDGAIYGTPLKKLWRSARTDLGDKVNLKHLKRIFVSTLYDLEITVKQGELSTTRMAYGEDNYNLLPFSSIGYDVCLELRAEGDLNVRGMTLIFDINRRYSK